MIFSEFMNDISAFYQAHPLIAIAGGLILICLIYRNPKFFLYTTLLALLFAGALYFILTAGSSSVSRKDRLLQKSQQLQQKE